MSLSVWCFFTTILLFVSPAVGHERGCTYSALIEHSVGQCCGSGIRGSDRDTNDQRNLGKGCCLKKFNHESRVDVTFASGLSLNAAGQEGHSFCVVPEHYQASDLRSWKNFRTFRTLFEVHGMDIGTHTSPTNYEKMNKFNPKSRDVECYPEDGNGYLNRPATVNDQPDADCVNPYIIQVTEIFVGGIRMTNWLHIVVRADAIRQRRNAKNCPTGKMKFILLEVRDELGNPVGEFTDEIPCHKGNRTAQPRACPSGLNCKVVYGSKRNTMPCMFTPHYAMMHPSIFMAHVSDFFFTASEDKNYFTELHLTWRFAQHTSHFISQLHFASLIIENEKRLAFYTSRRHRYKGEFACVDNTEQSVTYTNGNSYRHSDDPKTPIYGFYGIPPSRKVIGYIYHHRSHLQYDWEYGNEYGGAEHGFKVRDYYVCYRFGNSTTGRPYGFNARYTILYPKLTTLGAPEYYQKEFVNENSIDCHVQVAPSHYSTGNAFKGRVPKRTSTYTNDYQNPRTFVGKSFYGNRTDSKGVAKDLSLEAGKDDKYHKLVTKYSTITDETGSQPLTTYFGTKHTKQSLRVHISALPTRIWQLLNSLPTIAEIAETQRCPCPALPTTPSPEFATKPPLEIEGRRAHAIQMFIAWVVLVPLGIYSARYYKETYSRVFFLQEFWWYTVHILCLVTAAMFTYGGIYALEVKRQTERAWSKETKHHVYIGYTTIVVFTIHLLLGAFRVYDIYSRIIQIILHWTFGWLEYLFGVATIFLASGIPQGLMSCEMVTTYCLFLVLQLAFYVGMEIHMRLVDRKLKLQPPRTYLPAPVMRVFHKNAPYAATRVLIMMVYFLICCLFCVVLMVLLPETDDDTSGCHEPTPQKSIGVIL